MKTRDAAMSTDPQATLDVSKYAFDTTPDGQAIDAYRLTNARGMEVTLITYGARIQAIRVPDRNGSIDDVVLGFDHVAGYILHQDTYFGALIGRFGNRIADGQFTLDGQRYQLPINNGPNSLHGGTTGFDSRVWAAAAIETPESVGVEMTYFSPDGEMGFPGNLAVTVRYTLDDANNLRLHYSAVCDRDTVINLTNHSYFNLAGAGRDTVHEHVAWLNADTFTPVNAALIPTGERQAVAGTPLDFTTPTAIGARMHDDDAQLKYAEPEHGGYDFNWIFNNHGDLARPVVRVADPDSGRVVQMMTTEPGVQFYTSNFLDGTIVGKDEWRYAQWGAFTLEAQHFPDAPNQPDFPSTRLRAGEKYTQTTVYQFSSE